MKHQQRMKSLNQFKNQYSIQHIQKLLEAVKVEVINNHTIDKIQIQLYLSQRNNLFQFQHSISVINFKELVDITNNEDKVKYLQNQWIQIKMNSAQMDFKTLKQFEKNTNLIGLTTYRLR